MVLHVDVISDVICPWCYTGKRRLEKAGAAFGGPVQGRWLPFQLNRTEGRDLSDRPTLLDVVAEAGLDRHGAEALLSSADGLEAIKEGDALARRLGVAGVPFFIVNSTLTLSGDQPPDAFLEALRQAATSSDSHATPSRPST
jgi:predicted DsbA family dithiol-disulfide isomerase